MMIRAGVTVVLLTGTALMGAAAAWAGGAYVPPLPEAVPPNPAPGMCYARVEIRAPQAVRTETVMVSEGYETFAVSEPQLRARQETVMVKEPSFHYRVRQPAFKSVSERVMTRPGYEKLTVRPPQFKTVTEHVQISGPQLVWKKGNPTRLRAQGYKIHSMADSRVRTGHYHGNTTLTNCGTACEIWCLVEEPAKSSGFTRNVLVAPSEVQRVAVPPRFTTVTKQVMTDPGGVEKIPVPAQYKAITIEEVVAPAQVSRQIVPPQYKQVTASAPSAPTRYEWRAVDCSTQSGYRAPLRSSHQGVTYSTSSHGVISQRGSYVHGTGVTGARTVSSGGTGQYYGSHLPVGTRSGTSHLRSYGPARSYTHYNR